MDRLKKWAPLLLGLIGVVWLWSHLGGPEGSGGPGWYEYTMRLLKAHYRPADVLQGPSQKVEELVPPDKVREEVRGEGYWIPQEPIEEGDSVEVELSLIEIDGTLWGEVLIDSTPVVWEGLGRFLRPPPPGDWAGGVSLVVVPEFDMGAVVSRRLGTLWGVHGELALWVDIRETITDPPEWGAIGGRLSIPVYRDLEIGPGAGLRISRHGLQGQGSLEVVFRL